MNKLTPCHRCIENESFPALLTGVKDKCYTCDGEGFLLETHATIFELGFAEEINIIGDGVGDNR